MLDAVRRQIGQIIGAKASITLPRLILDQLPVGIVIARAPDGEVLLQNLRGDEILGHGVQEAERLPDIYIGAMHADGRPFAQHDHALVRVLATGRPITGEHCLYRRPDGQVADLLFDADIIVDEDGTPALAVATFQDISAQRHAERRQAALELRLAGVLEATSDSVFVLDGDWRFSFLNARAKAMLADGRDLVGQVVWEAFPEAVGGDFWRAYHVARETGETTTAREHYGPLGRTFEARANPFEDGLAVFFRDVTVEHEAEEAQKQLTRELAHRVGNLFTLVAGMVKMTARSADSAMEMAEKLTGRIVALSRAHELVRPAPGGSGAAIPTTLQALATAILAPHDDGEARVRIACDGVPLGPDSATALALVLHELATNAAKYGALGKGGGLDLAAARTGEEMVLLWREETPGGVAAPSGQSGFGSTLVQATARSRLRGRVDYDWRPEGVSVRLAFPAASLSR